MFPKEYTVLSWQPSPPLHPWLPAKPPCCSLTLRGKVMGQHKAYGPGTQGAVPVCVGVRTSFGDQCPTLTPVSSGTSHLSQDKGGALNASPILSKDGHSGAQILSLQCSLPAPASQHVPDSPKGLEESSSGSPITQDAALGAGSL